MRWASPDSEAVNAWLYIYQLRIQRCLISNLTVGGGESCRTLSSMPARVARSTGLMRTCCRATPSSPWPTGTLHAPSDKGLMPVWRASDIVTKKWVWEARKVCDHLSNPQHSACAQMRSNMNKLPVQAQIEQSDLTCVDGWEGKMHVACGVMLQDIGQALLLTNTQQDLLSCATQGCCAMCMLRLVIMRKSASVGKTFWQHELHGVLSRLPGHIATLPWALPTAPAATALHTHIATCLAAFCQSDNK